MPTTKCLTIRCHWSRLHMWGWGLVARTKTRLQVDNQGMNLLTCTHPLPGFTADERSGSMSGPWGSWKSMSHSRTLNVQCDPRESFTSRFGANIVDKVEMAVTGPLDSNATSVNPSNQNVSRYEKRKELIKRRVQNLDVADWHWHHDLGSRHIGLLKKRKSLSGVRTCADFFKVWLC
jgi:hypothetical protein